MAASAEGKRRPRRDAGEWQAVLGRFAASGLSVAAFCRQESLTPASFYRWRALLAQGRDQVAPIASVPDFVDLGMQGSAPGHNESRHAGRLELKLELGGGLVLHLVRG